MPVPPGKRYKRVKKHESFNLYHVKLIDDCLPGAIGLGRVQLFQARIGFDAYVDIVTRDRIRVLRTIRGKRYRPGIQAGLQNGLRTA
jgi:hypothetical protein